MKPLFLRSDPALPRAERRRRAILEAALRIIATGGPDAVTHRRVAQEASVPLGSTTYYFESRDDLVREAFHHYLREATAFLVAIESERPVVTVGGVADLLVEVVRREFTDPVMVRAEYELVLYAARDEALARAFNSYERELEARLGETLGRLGAVRPTDAARTLIDLVRGFEIERLTRPDADVDALRRRLLPVVSALTATDTERSQPTRGRARTARRGAPLRIGGARS